jgi:hypothetical protein
MLRAVDPPRCHELPAMDHVALSHREAPVVARPHRSELAMSPHLLPLKACALTRCETVVPDSAADASRLLVELALEFSLHNRILRLILRRGLCKCHGGRCSECRHKYELDKSHGVSPSVTAVADFPTGHSHFQKHRAGKFVV